MSKPRVSINDLIVILHDRFGIDEPIFIEEIYELWSSYSKSYIFSLIRKAMNDKLIYKASMGSYYFPVFVPELNRYKRVSTRKIVEKRYIEYQGKVYGYYSGSALLNMAGFCNQVPNTLEVVTNNESSNKRWINLNGMKYILRKSKTEINATNAPIFQILEIFKDFDQPLMKYQIENIFLLLDNQVVNKDLVKQIAKYFPKRAYDNLKKSAVGDIFT